MRNIRVRILAALAATSIAGVVACAAPVSAAVAATGDANGDGRSELVVSVPGEDLAVANAGAVHVFAGTSVGLRNRGSQFWHQDTEAVPGVAAADDRFGAAWAWGDFDRDGFDDLAIGAPGDTVGALTDAGSVTVLMGSPFGLGATEAVTFDQDSPSIPGAAEQFDRFGAALVAGDFDGDGRDDLAIGAPGEDIGAASDAGIVHVLEGSPTGLTGSGSIALRQEQVGGASETGDLFGSDLAAGDLVADTRDDLVISAPNEELAAVGQGRVTILRGSSGGVATSGAITIDQDSPGVPGTGEEDDAFGLALAVGDFDDDQHLDLVVSSPGESVGAATIAGAIHVFSGSADGLTTAGSRQIYQGFGSPGTAETLDRFGLSLVPGDFDDDGRDDLAIGVPGESFAGFISAGQVLVLRGSKVGLNAAGAQTWTQDSPGVADVPELDDAFGASLTSGDYNGDGRADIAVTSREGVGGQARAGAVHVLYGSATGIVATGSQLLTQDSVAVADTAETDDEFGLGS